MRTSRKNSEIALRTKFRWASMRSASPLTPGSLLKTRQVNAGLRVNRRAPCVLDKTERSLQHAIDSGDGVLTNVLSRKKLTIRQIIQFHRMRWGIEVEFRGLKQTLDKHKLRCRNSTRAYVELDWSIRALAFAERGGGEFYGRSPLSCGRHA
jgi:hypothetical protein